MPPGHHSSQRVAEHIDPRFAPMVLPAGFRGMRFGELDGLQPVQIHRIPSPEIDLHDESTLKEAKGGRYRGTPKHGRVRKVPLAPFLLDALEAYLQAYPPRSGLVFTGPKDAPLWRGNFEEDIWKRAVVSAGFDRRLTHSLKRTAVSILVRQGVQPAEMAKMMGWSRTTAAAMTMQYHHLAKSRRPRSRPSPRPHGYSRGPPVPPSSATHVLGDAWRAGGAN
ncbi:MAG: tyrosine-type recombinase/integrase [Actinomycetota bacterium]